MPNWVINEIQFKTTDEKFTEIVNTITSEEGYLDFNKILPMPEELIITAGSITDLALEAYRKYKEGSSLEEAVSDKTAGFIDDNTIKNSTGVKIDLDDSPKMRVIKFGERYHRNIEEFGAPTWYEWCIDQWGTKWNASRTEIMYEKKTIRFATAWSNPYPVIERLSEMFPDIDMEVKYADEDIGYNCGAYTINGNTIEEQKIDNLDKFAYELWGY